MVNDNEDPAQDESAIPSHFTRFQKEIYRLEQDERVHKQVTLGKRTGMYCLLGEIGAGSFSKVKKGSHVLLKETVAVKIVDKLSLEKKTQKMLFREIDNMVILHHPNIIRLFEVVEDADRMHIVLEYAPGGELHQKLMNEGKLQEEHAKTLFSQIVAAVSHIHNLNVVHRDLKAENVFFFYSDLVKLGDFGFSTISEQGQGLTTFCGSPPYAAPELFTDASYSGFCSDIWALGVLLYFMTSGVMPFTADSLGKLKQNIVAGNFSVTQYTSCSLKNLLADILQLQANKRPTIKQIMQSDWLLGYTSPISYPSSNQMVPKLTKSGSISKNGTSDEVLESQTQVITYMQKTLGVPSIDLRVANNFSQQSKHCTLGIFRILMHRLQNGESLERHKKMRHLAHGGFELDDEESLCGSTDSSVDYFANGDQDGSSFYAEGPPPLRQKMNKSAACVFL